MSVHLAAGDLTRAAAGAYLVMRKQAKPHDRSLPDALPMPKEVAGED